MVEQSILEQLGFQVGEATLDEKASTLLGTIVWIEVPVLLYKLYLPEFAIQLLNNLHAHFIAFFFWRVQ